jgi:LacI family transcriptional regulator
LLEELSTKGLTVAPEHEIEMETMTIESGETAMNDLMTGRNLPTAVFCGNDLMAIGAERAALDGGLRIPEDVAIVGYDDIRFAATSLVPLTSVRNPAYELGFEAATLLIEEATDVGTHKHRNILLQPQLIVRASTDTSA